MNEARDHRGLRQRLNPLLTSSLGVPSQHNNNAPVSALSYNSNPHHVQTPVSAIQPYNPREWLPSPMPGPGPAPGPERAHQMSNPSSTGMPLPPPPYSPPRGQRPVSMYVDGYPAANMLSARNHPSHPTMHRPSPEPPSNQSFPPPPNTRGSSRERRFGLPAFGRKREPGATPSPEPHIGMVHHPPPPPIVPSRPGPLTIQIPQFPAQRIGSDASPQGIPPGSRRAMSTSAIDTPTSARSRSASQPRWDPNVPLPPPPPGPPPAPSRSQSTNRDFTGGGDPVASPPTRRPPPSGVTALGPVPPTPANWVDKDQPDGHRPAREPSLEREQGSEHPAIDNTDATEEPSASSSSPGLNRTNALRGEKTLRERRNESRTRGSRLSIDASIPGLDQIIIPPSSAGLSRKMTIGRRTPRSAGYPRVTSLDGVVASDEEETSGSTPKAINSARGQLDMHMQISTPPFSPRLLKAQEALEDPAAIAPKALPTPPPHSRSSSVSRPRAIAEASITTPLSSKPTTRDSVVRQTPEQFSRDTIERFQAFARREATVADDAERVRLFAEFVVSESRIRRERYSAAISAMGSEIFDLTRDLFRPMTVRRESVTSQASEWTPRSSLPSRSHRGSISSVFQGESSKQGESSSAPASASIIPMSPSGPPPNNANWGSDYRPTLSPILSMSVSDNRDGDSRGRPASRWWESASSGDTSGWERSKRESKYMSVPKEGREALQWLDGPGESSGREPTDEYPPEKQGWHEQQPEETCQSYTPQPLRTPLGNSLSFPSTPNPHHLDISRLVTLPPPYPRHHPAVNNNHPNLAEIRTTVRTLSDLAEVDATKDRFNRDSRAARDQATEAANKRRQALRLNLQQEVGLGRMTYGEAAAIEADSNETEKQAHKDMEKKDFDRFQTDVVAVLNELLTTRIGKATQLFDDLRSRLFVETREPNPNMPQEEGDEHPELLEKLTLLKWIFEARELLHRAVYHLLSDRNDRYREMVITPYRLAGNEEKLAHASAFFAEDAAKRALAFAREVLQRMGEFRDVVEENVIRGVEVQLSAFWDIAPPLCRLLDQVPLGPGANGDDQEEGASRGGGGSGVRGTLAGFRIQIPQSEMVENPSYVDHPLQYLFSLLLHAEKSTYQFIESQTNLLCLLHEVKEALVAAQARVMEEEGRSRDEVEAMRTEEGRRLTDDLKDKVRAVQDQWRSALGDRVTHVKERVGEWLLETGGWDESLEEGGVGSL